MNLYLTADTIGIETGGGKVTQHEANAMVELGTDLDIMDRDILQPDPRYEPWSCDLQAEKMVDGKGYQLCHIYAGTWGKTVKKLKDQGCKVSVTIAAHDRKISREEHEKLGIPFAYPHLVDPDLWQRYIEGYRLADVIICPGSVPAKTVREYGPDFMREKRIEIIPHGCEIPETIVLPPERFTVGYMGSIGADKGVRYLLEAWKKLNYKDALLVIAGKDSTSQAMYSFLEVFGGGAVCLAGWQDSVSKFYNSISCFVCPAVTEGFNIEVVEAMACARPVLCSDGAGACDLVHENMRFPARNVDALAEKIDYVKKMQGRNEIGVGNREIAKQYTWERIRQRYIEVWRSMINA